MIAANATEPEMFSFFQLTPDLVCIAGKDGYFKSINNAVVETLGYSREELFARPIASFIHPDDSDVTGSRRKELLTGKTLMDFENRYIKKNGDIVWLHWTSIYSAEKEIVFAIAKDVTERKLKEKQIEEQYLRAETIARHFKTSLEKEKRSLATELHEELAQLASVAKMDIDTVRSNLPGVEKNTLDKIDHALVMLDLLISSIRKLSYSISPNMLHDLGLNETLQTLAEDFTAINGIPCFFESEINDKILTEEISIDLFRICQESLKNVALHSHANSVHVKLETNGQNLCLSIIDDGKGFEQEELDKSFGLASMRQRAASVNGELTIKSEMGKGTSVQVCIAISFDDNKLYQ